MMTFSSPAGTIICSSTLNSCVRKGYLNELGRMANEMSFISGINKDSSSVMSLLSKLNNPPTGVRRVANSVVLFLLLNTHT